MDAALWGVFGATAYFSAGNVYAFAVSHDTPAYVAVVLAPIVDVALFSIIMGDSILGRAGVVLGSSWPKALRIFAGSATWVLNVWPSAHWFEDARMDVPGVVLHSIPPLVLILLAEATPVYRAAFAEAVQRVRTAAVPVRTAPVSVPRTGTAPATQQPVRPTRPAAPKPVPVPAAPRIAPTTEPVRTDDQLLAVLADAVQVPRDPDGTVPVRRAAKALGCGPDRARRLLATAGLLRTPVPETQPALHVVAAHQ